MMPMSFFYLPDFQAAEVLFPTREKGRCPVKQFVMLALVLAGVCGAAVAEDERTLIAPKDDKPFVVEETDFVRLTGKGIAGSRIEFKVEGAATIESTSHVRELVDGHPLIGNTAKEFVLKPTGKGKVTATITVTSPIPGSKPQVRTVVFEVK